MGSVRINIVSTAGCVGNTYTCQFINAAGALISSTLVTQNQQVQLAQPAGIASKYLEVPIGAVTIAGVRIKYCCGTGCNNNGCYGITNFFDINCGTSPNICGIYTLTGTNTVQFTLNAIKCDGTPVSYVIRNNETVTTECIRSGFSTTNLTAALQIPCQ